MHKTLWQRPWRLAAVGMTLFGLASATGCQSLIGGQVLPSPWYQQDDIQYFQPGPEFKLSREAAAQKAFKEDKVAEEGP